MIKTGTGQPSRRKAKVARSKGREAGKGIQILDEIPIEGLATAYQKLGKGRTPDELAEQLREHARRSRTPLPAGRGPKEWFGWIRELLGRRRLLKDLGDHPAAIDWLSLHVPPGGGASFSVENKSKNKAGVTLRVFGAGFGAGRAVTLGVKEDFLDRKRCVRLTHHVILRVKSYDVGRGPECPDIESNVTRISHLEVRPWDPCPVCGKKEDTLDPFTYEPAGPGLDLTRDTVGQKRSEELHLKATAQAEIGLPLNIPGLPADSKIGFSTERELELTCKTNYTFPPGGFFAPYKELGPEIDLPFWAVR